MSNSGSFDKAYASSSVFIVARALISSRRDVTPRVKIMKKNGIRKNGHGAYALKHTHNVNENSAATMELVNMNE